MPDPIAIKWKCPACNSTSSRTIIEDGKVFVPLCGKCREKGGKNHACREGVLQYAEGAEGAPAPISTIDFRRGAVAKSLAKDETFGYLCDILDANRTMMGDGSLSSASCRGCETRCTSHCQCACHAAWAFRAKVESAVEAA